MEGLCARWSRRGLRWTDLDDARPRACARLKERFLLPYRDPDPAARRVARPAGRGALGRWRGRSPTRRSASRAVNWVRPRALRPGDLVGVCAPCGRRSNPDRLDRGVAALRALGFEVRVAPGVRARTRFTAGPAGGRLRRPARALRRRRRRGHRVRARRRGRDRAPALTSTSSCCARIRRCSWATATSRSCISRWPGSATSACTVPWWRASWRTAPSIAGELPPPRSRATGPPYASEPEDLMVRARGGGVRRLARRVPLAAGRGRGNALGLASRTRTRSCSSRTSTRRPIASTGCCWQLRTLGRAATACAASCFGDMRGCAPPLDADYALEDVLLDALDGLDVPIALGLSSGHTTTRS